MERDNDIYYSVSDLVALNLPNFPTSRQGVDAHVKRENWPFKEEKGLGGPGGIKRVYLPPPDLRRQIEIQRKIYDATPGNIPLHMMDAVEAQIRKAAGALAPTLAEPDPAPDRPSVRNFESFASGSGDTALVARCIVAAESVMDQGADRLQQVSLGVETAAALGRMFPDKAQRFHSVSDADLALLARFIMNSRKTLFPAAPNNLMF